MPLDDVDARPGRARSGRDLHDRPQLPRPGRAGGDAPGRGRWSTARPPRRSPAHGATLAWDRALTANVDAEVELGVVIGAPAWQVDARGRDGHVFGYTIINDVSSRDPWLDGDQWLLGKSMPGFCPVGPWVVTADELDPTDLAARLHHQRRADPGRPDLADALRRSPRSSRTSAATSRCGPATSSRPARRRGSPAPPGPDRHLEAGDVVTVWIEGIGELTTTIA